jgi:hypothetical protein
VFGSKPGDYDRNNVVNSIDYLDWSSAFGSTTNRGADGNLDGVVDAADYVMWRKLVGAGGGGTATVPEPTGLVWLTVAAVLCMWRGRRHWT